MFLATRQKSRDQIVSCSLVSDEKFVLAIVASSKKLKVKTNQSLFWADYLPVYPLSLGNAFVFRARPQSDLRHDRRKRCFSRTTCAKYRISRRTLICYTNYVPKSPRILRKVSSGNALNSSSDNVCKSIFLLPLAPSPFISGG